MRLHSGTHRHTSPPLSVRFTTNSEVSAQTASRHFYGDIYHERGYSSLYFWAQPLDFRHRSEHMQEEKSRKRLHRPWLPIRQNGSLSTPLRKCENATSTQVRLMYLGRPKPLGNFSLYYVPEVQHSKHGLRKVFSALKRA